MKAARNGFAVLLVMMWTCCLIGLTTWILNGDWPTVAWWAFMTFACICLTVDHVREYHR